MKKKNKIVTEILKDYYRDHALIILFERQLEVLNDGLGKNKFITDIDRDRISKKISSLKRKIETLKFKNCQIDLIMESIREKSEEDYEILDMKFRRGFLNVKIGLNLNYTENTIWQKENALYKYVYECLDDEFIEDARKKSNSESNNL
jgi:ribosome-associated translation inhibitor RaiA